MKITTRYFDTLLRQTKSLKIETAMVEHESHSLILLSV